MGVELGPHGIRVNSVGPTYRNAPDQTFFENKEFTADTISRIALGKIGQVEDVADAVVYLASPASGMAGQSPSRCRVDCGDPCHG